MRRLPLDWQCVCVVESHNWWWTALPATVTCNDFFTCTCPPGPCKECLPGCSQRISLSGRAAAEVLGFMELALYKYNYFE